MLYGWACGKPFRPSLTTSPRPRPVMRIHPSQMHSTFFFFFLFWFWFEMQNDIPVQKLHTPPDDQALCLFTANVRTSLFRINQRKAAGLDSIPGRVLRVCAAQLTDVLTDIFNTLLSQAVAPTFQIHNNYTGTKEIICVLFKWLPSHTTDPNHNEVLWEISHAQHQNRPPQHTRSTPVCITSKPLYRWCNFLHPPSGSYSPRK